jgi:hypothetical protein
MDIASACHKPVHSKIDKVMNSVKHSHLKYKELLNENACELE